ncbi:MAG: ATP-binding protein [Halioglobus sp.]
MPDKPEQKNMRLVKAFMSGPMLVTRVCIWLREALMSLSIEETLIGELILVAEEVIANIDEHGQLPDNAEIEVFLTSTAREMQLEITDPGVPFNPLLEAGGASLGAEIDSAEIGGLGVHLITELTDYQFYRREAQRNILHLTKQLGAKHG